LTKEILFNILCIVNLNFVKKELNMDTKVAKARLSKKEISRILALHSKWLKCEADGKRAIFSFIDLSDEDLSYSNLRGAVFMDTDLRGSSLKGSDLRDIDFMHIDLSRADLRDADARGSDFRHAKLVSSDLRGANFGPTDLGISADFLGADICGADFRESILTGVDLRNTEPKKSNFRGASDLETVFGKSLVAEIIGKKEAMYAHIGSGTIDTESGWEQTFKDIYADPHAYGYRAEGEEAHDDDGLEDLPTESEFWTCLDEVEDEKGEEK
jgi:uncharacterized protein YjbI with pentapeptide repeats